MRPQQAAGSRPGGGPGIDIDTQVGFDNGGEMRARMCVASGDGNEVTAACVERDNTQDQINRARNTILKRRASAPQPPERGVHVRELDWEQ